GDRAVGEDGDALHVGLGVGKTFGADGRGSAGLNLAAGWQKQTMVRRQDIFEPAFGTSRIKTDYLAADVSLGYSFGSGPWFVRPNVDASAIRLSLDGFDEQGLDGLGMAVDKSDEWYLSIEPKLTVGARFNQVHFALTGGGLFANKDEIRAPMRFIGAGAASDPAIISTMIDDQAFVGGLELGIDASNRFDVSVGYQGVIGSQVESHTATVNMRLRF
ncbi:MAG TPA: autotransporter outer membrane beta-barrel domain-containing protein, partial [Croceibacterium sp.]|nr:autotransporter outer membrane beta-barrel domain-containing protein [Croceibacterium sp.]